MRTAVKPPPPFKRCLQPAPLCAVVADVPVDRLIEFRRLMQGDGWPVDVARMCHDRLYAYERMAQAHTSASARLRTAAVTLFADYERLPVDPRLH